MGGGVLVLGDLTDVAGTAGPAFKRLLLADALVQFLQVRTEAFRFGLEALVPVFRLEFLEDLLQVRDQLFRAVRRLGIFFLILRQRFLVSIIAVDIIGQIVAVTLLMNETL